MKGSNSQVVLVTGSTSGIGLAIAKLFLSQGYTVHGNSRNKNIPDEIKLNSKYHHHIGDVSIKEQAENIVNETLDTEDHINILVNCAGRNGGGNITQIDDDLWESVIATNLSSVFYVTRRVLQVGGMIERKNGRIISIASTAGKQGVLLATPYCASKHGVVGFMKSLAQELAPYSITVNTICPGYVETPMAKNIRTSHAKYWGKSEEEILDQFSKKIPLGRYSTPDEVAGMVGYLSSASAASITAQAINVCGGLGRY